MRSGGFGENLDVLILSGNLKVRNFSEDQSSACCLSGRCSPYTGHLLSLNFLENCFTEGTYRVLAAFHSIFMTSCLIRTTTPLCRMGQTTRPQQRGCNSMYCQPPNLSSHPSHLDEIRLNTCVVC